MAALKGLRLQDLADPGTILRLHGIKPWGEKDIDSYMAQQVANYRGNLAWRLQKYVPKAAIQEIIGCGTFTALVMMVVGGILCLIGVCINAPEMVTDFGNLAICSVIAIAAMLVFCIWDASLIVDGVRWDELSLSKAAPMPPFAKETMAKAAAVFPGSFFTIAELRQTLTHGLVDPVLFQHVPMSLNPPRWKKIPVAVWDADDNEVPSPQ